MLQVGAWALESRGTSRPIHADGSAKEKRDGSVRDGRNSRGEPLHGVNP